MEKDSKIQKKLIDEIGILLFALSITFVSLLLCICFLSIIVAVTTMLNLEVISDEPPAEHSTNEILDIVLTVSMCPLLEEFMFRFVIQNFILRLQLWMPSLFNNKIMGWLKSVQMRILFVTFIFSLVHLRNAGKYLSRLGAVRQVILIFVLCPNTRLYETTGNFLVPLMCHIMHNAFLISIELFVSFWFEFD